VTVVLSSVAMVKIQWIPTPAVCGASLTPIFQTRKICAVIVTICRKKLSNLPKSKLDADKCQGLKWNSDIFNGKEGNQNAILNTLFEGNEDGSQKYFPKADSTCGYRVEKISVKTKDSKPAIYDSGSCAALNAPE